jgi:hypothetical protein
VQSLPLASSFYKDTTQGREGYEELIDGYIEKGVAPVMQRKRTGTNFARSGHASISGSKIRHHDSWRVRCGRRQLLTEPLAVIRGLSPTLQQENIIKGTMRTEQYRRR